MGLERGLKGQYLQCELKPIDHRVGVRECVSKKTLRLLRWALRNSIQLALFAAFIVSVAGAAVIDRDPKVHAWVYWSAIKETLVTIGLGGIVSYIFYWVAVFLPESRRRGILRRQLLKSYEISRHNILWAVLGASVLGGRRDLALNSETFDKASSFAGFRALFEKGSKGTEGYYAFQNQMSEATAYFSEIVFQLQVISEAIEFTLSIYPVDDENILRFLYGTSVELKKIKNNGAGYDESKQLCGFVWVIAHGGG
jgi:hypothetical protein